MKTFSDNSAKTGIKPYMCYEKKNVPQEKLA